MEEIFVLVGTYKDWCHRTQYASVQADQEPTLLPGPYQHLQLHDLVIRKASERAWSLFVETHEWEIE